MLDQEMVSMNNEELVELTSVVIDPTLPKEERIKSFIEQIKNPYKFKINGVVVTVSYNESGPTLQELLEAYIKTVYS